MYDRLQSQSQGRNLIQLGVVLLLFGLPATLVLLGRMPVTMEMADQVDACINGIFLILLGLVWSSLKLPHSWRLVVFRLTLYGTLFKWLALLLLIWWVAQDSWVSPSAGNFLAFTLHDILLSLAWFFLIIAVIVGCLLAAYAVHRSRMAPIHGLGERSPPVT